VDSASHAIGPPPEKLIAANKADLGNLEKSITADLATTRGDFEKLFATKSEI
jgi:hypothetical protein